MDAPDPLDELERQLIADTKRNWRKMEYIAAKLAEKGRKSPVTRKDVTKTDVSRDFHAQGISMWEVTNGEITDEALAEFERARAKEEKGAVAPKKKPAAKKGRGT
jgi:hypothetical protein